MAQQTLLSPMDSLSLKTRAEQESNIKKSPSTSSQRDFFDHRPWPDFALHVGLQVEAFGKFIQFMNSDDVDGKYGHVASNLMKSMSGVFENENKRVEEFKRIVENLDQNFKLTKEKETRRAHDVTGYKSDGTLKIKGRCVVNWEFKNESGNAVQQNNVYFILMQKGHHEDRSPMLLVSVIGCHYLQVFGAAWDGKRACIDPLSDPVSLLYVPQDPKNGVLKVARLLSSMDKAIRELSEYYGKPQEERNRLNVGPYWNDNGNLLEYNQTSPTIRPPWVFEAKYETDKAATVKFVQGHYGEAVHQYLATRSLAPKLYKCKSLPGGWYAVVMEKLKGKLATTTGTLNRKMKESLKNAVKLMHDNDMVHGDLRAENILVLSDDTVRILEFDWADKVEIATYPPDLDPIPELRHPEVEVKCGGMIKKDHDTFQKNLLLTVPSS